MFFEDAWFENAARFDDACFASCSDARVSFLMARFAGYTSFEAAIFGGDIRFDAIRGESVFDLAGASFDALPSFIQANFKEPPRFDHLTLKTPLASSERRESLARALGICARQCWERRGGLSAEEKAEARDTTSKFRALKALAIKAHDGEREHLFFKGEMRARRISEDEGWAVRAGNVAYDLFSDFGRSFLRPLAVWLVLLFGFSGAYWAGSFPVAPRTGCDRLSAFGYSIYLGVRSGLVLLGSVKDERLTDAYLCLFGRQTIPANLPPDPPHAPGDPLLTRIPDIPAWVTAAEMAHSFFSVILIFLIALAIRNQFKIK